MRIVLSLTSTPRRVGRVGPTLDSLLAQDCRFDALYLWLPRKMARTGDELAETPEELRELANREPRLKVTLLEEDYGPATKLLPTLRAETDPDTLIFYCDDDMHYAAEVLGWLVECAGHWPEAALGTSLLDFDRSRRLATSDRETSLAVRPAIAHGQTAEVIEGYGGVLVRRGFFGDGFAQLFPPIEQLLDDTMALDANLSDDVMISSYLRQRGVALTNVCLPGCNRTSVREMDYAHAADALQSLGTPRAGLGNLARYTRVLPWVSQTVARVVSEETG